MTEEARQLLRRASELIHETGTVQTYKELDNIPCIGSKQIAGLAMAVAERLDEMDKRINKLEQRTYGPFGSTLSL